MSRILIVLAIAACGSVKNNPEQDAPGDPDSAVADSPSDTRTPVWSAYQLVTINRPGDVRNPAVTNDGLGLFFSALVNDPNGDIFDVIQASRNTTASDFGLGSVVANVNVAGRQARYVEISGDGLEIYYTDGTQIMMASRGNTNATFSTPISAGSGITGNFPSISADKLSLYFISVVAGMSAMGEFTVATRAAVGQPFSNPVALPLAGTVDIFSSIDISQDELAVVRAPPYTGTNLTPPIISRRASKSAPFTNTDEVLPVVDFLQSNAFTSARFAQNDTEVWISQNDGTNIELAFVSKLE